jgi:ketosteroid isomerase-like protein
MSDHRYTMERFFEAMLAGDHAALGELCTDDVTWHLPPFAQQRFGSPKGRTALLEFLGSAEGEFFEPGSMRFRPEVHAIEGDQAVAIGWMRGRTAAGRDYGNRYAWGLRFRDGRICDIWELLDTVHYQAQVGTDAG